MAAWYFLRGDDPPDWDRTLEVVVYPENTDGSAETARYIRGLTSDRFDAIERYMAEQAAKYDLAPERPFEIVLADPVSGTPKAPDYESFVAHVRWGLGVRFWYWWQFDDQGLDPDIVLIARYRSEPRDARLHSLGIPAMDLGIVNLEADIERQGLNNVVLAHELLHTVGADDLYDRRTGLPVYPEGYVDPDRQPRYPQPKAELMAGRIPVARGRAVQAKRLEEAVIGTETAIDIGWADPSDTGPPSEQRM